MKRIKFKKINWKKVISAVLVIGIFTASLAFIVKFASSETKNVTPVFALGSLDENGEYVESKNSIYTKNAFECRGLKITPDFDSNVEYQVFYYGEHNQFVNASEVFTEAQHIPMNDLAVYARVVITPYDSNDMNIEMKVWDVPKYANAVKITVDRDQDYEVPNLFVEAKKNTYNGDENLKSMSADELLQYTFFTDSSFSMTQGETLKIYSNDITKGRNVCIIPCSMISSFYFDSESYISNGIAYCVSTDSAGNYILDSQGKIYNDFVFEIPENSSYFVVETQYNLEISVYEYR